jgi:sulfur carrier protein ThiS
MKIRVKVYGTLHRGFPSYNHDLGMEVEIREGEKIVEVLERLGLNHPQGGMVVLDGRVMKKEDALEGGSMLQVFQPVFGG